MAVTQAWDETAPAATASPRDGDDEMREGIKQATRERMNIGGHYWPSGTDTKSGRHQCGQENAASGDGTPLTGEFYIYAANGTTRLVTVGDSTAAAPSRFLASTLTATFDEGLFANELVAGGTTPTTGATKGLTITSGGIRWNTRLVTATGNLLSSDGAVFINTANAVALTMPGAASSFAGHIISVSSIVTPSGTNAHSLTPFAGDSFVVGSLSGFLVGGNIRLAIGGGTLTGTIMLISDGVSQWIAIGGIPPS